MLFSLPQKEYCNSRNMKITIIDYGAGNVFSVKAAFNRLGFNPIVSSDKHEVSTADYVIFPGVGHAEFAMNELKAKQLDVLIPNLKQPVLGICLGMQLMCESTEEGNIKSLGIFENVHVKKFPNQVNTPHTGWNNLLKTKDEMIDFHQDVYFVHSYYAEINSYTTATCNYGLSFSASLKKYNFFACQFHPEKSGKVGEEILNNFLKTNK